jgi:biopolymer transport protein ExbD
MAEETTEGTDGPPMKANITKINQLIRRKLRRAPAHDETSLNIYPLMDVMTILLVFMIMQFAQEAAQVIESPELQIPYSSSRATLEQALAIQISRTEIVIEGRPVVPLRNDGSIDPSHKQGGGAGFLITPMHTVLLQHAERLKLIARNNPNRPFDGTVQIVADRRMPFRTLSEVLYTLGQAEFSNIHFVVLQDAQAN